MDKKLTNIGMMGHCMLSDEDLALLLEQEEKMRQEGIDIWADDEIFAPKKTK